MSDSYNFTDIHEALLRRYNMEELRTLCSALDVSFDDLPGEGRSGKAREMIHWLHRNRRLHELEPHLEGVKVVYRKTSGKPPADASASAVV